MQQPTHRILRVALPGTTKPRTGLGAGLRVVARGGVEPPTYRFSGGRSYQLSYLAGRTLAGATPHEHTDAVRGLPTSPTPPPPGRHRVTRATAG